MYWIIIACAPLIKCGLSEPMVYKTPQLSKELCAQVARLAFDLGQDDINNFKIICAKEE